MLGQDRLERARRGEWGALNERRGWIPETEILKLLLDFFFGQERWMVGGGVVGTFGERGAPPFFQVPRFSRLLVGQFFPG
jgi:hypothetical protein